jgi:hypothetical protein
LRRSGLNPDLPGMSFHDGFKLAHHGPAQTADRAILTRFGKNYLISGVEVHFAEAASYLFATG